MPGANAKKSVYFSKGEEYLKSWAEARPEGYSVYIKRLIQQDLEASRERESMRNVLEEYFASAECRQILGSVFKEVCSGYMAYREPEQISAEEATDILGLINGI